MHEVSDSLKYAQICEESPTTMEKQYFRVGVSKGLRIRQTSHLILAHLEIFPRRRFGVTTSGYFDVFWNTNLWMINDIKLQVGKINAGHENTVYFTPFSSQKEVVPIGRFTSSKSH